LFKNYFSKKSSPLLINKKIKIKKNLRKEKKFLKNIF